MKVKLLFSFSLLSLSICAQSPAWQWATTGGGNFSDKGTDIVRDATNGNLYITGYFNNSAAFGGYNLPYKVDSKETFIVKLNKYGNYLWAKRGTSYYDDRGLGMCLDPSGNVVATGTCWSDIEFFPYYVANTSGYSDEIWVTKINASGVFQWAVIAGNPDGDDHGYDVVSDKSGNLYVTGFISDNWAQGGGNADFGSISVPIPNGDTLCFLAKLSAGGTWQWVRTFGGGEGERDNRIAMDSIGNLYVAGGFIGNKTFGSTTINSNNVDIFVVKYDANGNFQWVKTAGSALDDRANAITIDHKDNIYITGEFRDKVGFGVDTVNNYGGPNGRDAFVARMRTNGSWVWASRAGSNDGGDRGDGIITNKKGNIFVTGQFTDTAKFGNTTMISGGGYQTFVSAIDTAGKWKWALQGGGVLEDRGNQLAIDDSCELYAVGYYRNAAQFGNYPLTSTGARDAFVTSIGNACFNYVEPPPPVPECDIFVPNVFSPNGDAKNDLECVLGNCLKSAHFTIFNRWGEMVFETTDFTKCWDGTYNGELCSTAVFVYYLLATDLSDQLVVKKGNITLMR